MRATKHDPGSGTSIISERVAVTIAIAFALALVAPFYLSKSLRISHSVSRNSPESIRARSKAVSLTCLSCTITTIGLLSILGAGSVHEIIQQLGLYPIILTDVVKPVILVAVLFAGPLYEAGLVDGGWRHWLRWRTIKAEIYDDWVGWRSLVVGPVSEELMFRSLNVSLLLHASMPATKIVWTAPLLFGVAHLHHLNEFIIAHQQPNQSYLSAATTPKIILSGIARTLFQLAFTSVFGALVTFIFLRTGNLYACILIHTFCNWMGFPRLWGRLGQDIEHEQNDSDGENDNSDSASSHLHVTSNGLGVGWTVAYYVLLFCGVFGFFKLRYPLTESSHGLADI